MYDGIVNVYKEQGYTSHDVVAKLRGIFGQKKVGHTGTLDPMAEGVLIVVLGRATKLADLIVTSRKRYIAEMQLGVTSDTDDSTGNVVESCGQDKLDEMFSGEAAFTSKLENVMQQFLGKSMQVPPMYSAIKINGKKLYEYARAGKEIEREARPVEIYRLEIRKLNVEKKTVSFEVECSKGTYIRSLIRDIGEKLGTGAVMSGLLRDEVNGITIDTGFRLDDLQKLKEEDNLKAAVTPMDILLRDVPKVYITSNGEKLLNNGNRLGIDDINMSGQDIQEIENARFFRVYLGVELKALYTYDKEKNNYKVFKML